MKEALRSKSLFCLQGRPRQRRDMQSRLQKVGDEQKGGFAQQKPFLFAAAERYAISPSKGGEKLDELDFIALFFKQFAVLHARSHRFLHASICKAAGASLLKSIFHACQRHATKGWDDV